MSGSKRSIPADSRPKRIDAAGVSSEPLELENEPSESAGSSQAARVGSGPGLKRVPASTKCRRCGYDLSGLQAAKVCPECGFTTKVRRRRVYSDQLAAASIEWLRVVNMGAKCLVLGMVLWISGVVAMEFGGSAATVMWPMSGLMLMWVGAALVLRDREASEYESGEGVKEMARERAFARWGFAGVVLGGAGAFVDRFVTSGLPAVYTLVSVAAVVGMASCVVLVVYMRRLALWANDDSTVSALQWSVVGMPLGVVAPLVWATWLGMTGIAVFLVSMLIVPAGLILVDGMVLFAIVKFERMTTWAIESNIAHMDRAMRDEERMMRGERSKAARIAREKGHAATDPGREGAPSRTTREGV